MDDFEEIFDASSIIQRIRKIVKTVRNSPQERKIFSDIVSSTLPGSPLNLLLDVKTRWNSTYLMLKRALDLQKAVEMYLLRNEKIKAYCTLSSVEWMALSEVVTLLEPMEEATRYLSKSKYPTISIALSIYAGLIEVINVSLLIFYNL